MEDWRIGTDLEENQRFERLLQKPSFFHGVYTPGEQAYLASLGTKRQPASAAGLFCAKAAVAKALGVGLYGLLPREIEIFHSPAGEPQVRLLGQAALRFPQVQLRVSISHTKTLATATALARVRVR